MTEAIRKAVAMLPILKVKMNENYNIRPLADHLQTIIAALEDMQGVAERHQFEIDARDNIINSKTKLLADERAEVQRLKQQLATARNDALREIVLLVDDFHWTLPVYESRAANEASDDAVEMVKGQICEALNALIKTHAPVPPAKKKGA
jgi:hypothetical protein